MNRKERRRMVLSKFKWHIHTVMWGTQYYSNNNNTDHGNTTQYNLEIRRSSAVAKAINCVRHKIVVIFEDKNFFHIL